MAEKVFLNDGLVDADKACIPVTDGGFLYGVGLFETMRSLNGVVFAINDHLERLFSSARALSIKHNYKKKYIAGAICELLRANKLSDARLRLTLTSGRVGQSEEERRGTLLISATQFKAFPAEFYKNGVLIALCPYRQNPNDPTCGHKSLNYFPRLMGLDLARKVGAAEALWFTTENVLAEGCISNVFLVRDSVLYTPRLATPVLAGVTRKIVCRLATKNSIELIEKDLYIDDCLAADEIFLTNSIMQIMPVSRLEKHEVGGGKAGVLTLELTKCFDEFVKEECGLKK
jgi:branched-chain amino acid aminotransferase